MQEISYGILISCGIIPLDDRLIFAFDAIRSYCLEQIIGNVIQQLQLTFDKVYLNAFWRSQHESFHKLTSLSRVKE